MVVNVTTHMARQTYFVAIAGKRATTEKSANTLHKVKSSYFYFVF